jgi:hypothetical protein
MKKDSILSETQSNKAKLIIDRLKLGAQLIKKHNFDIKKKFDNLKYIFGYMINHYIKLYVN